MCIFRPLNATHSAHQKRMLSSSFYEENSVSDFTSIISVRHSLPKKRLHLQLQLTTEEPTDSRKRKSSDRVKA